MTTRFLGFAAGIGLVLLTSVTNAGAAGSVFSVPGVLNTPTFATVFACTNHGPLTAPVLIEVFDGAGASQGQVPTSIDPGKSVYLSTQPVGSIVTTSMGFGSLLGSAKVAFSGKGLVCTAWTMAPGGTASYVNSLPFIRGAKQK